MKAKAETTDRLIMLYLACYDSLLHTVVGCADLELSKGAIMERKADDELIVRCPGSRETWYMTCGANNQWIGQIFNCSTS